MMVSQGLAEGTDIILGPSYKGSAIALATTISLWKDHRLDLPFEYDRKEAKTHGEATSSKSVFVNRTFFDGCRIFVVDDVATSMGTKIELLEKIQAEAQARDMAFRVVGIGIGIDREQTTAVYDSEGAIVSGQKGKNAIRDFVSKSGIPVYSVAGIREVIEYLFEEKLPVMIHGKKAPIDDKTKAAFDEYLKIYGID
jgi:orotate phosphoribosyltransferase